MIRRQRDYISRTSGRIAQILLLFTLTFTTTFFSFHRDSFAVFFHRVWCSILIYTYFDKECSSLLCCQHYTSVYWCFYCCCYKLGQYTFHLLRTFVSRWHYHLLSGNHVRCKITEVRAYKALLFPIYRWNFAECMTVRSHLSLQINCICIRFHYTRLKCWKTKAKNENEYSIYLRHT